MKLFCLIFAHILLALILMVKADFKEETLALSRLCQKERPVPDKELEKYFRNGLNAADATEGVKCHMRCMMDKRGYFKNGKFDEQLFLKGSTIAPAMRTNEALFAKVSGICKSVPQATNECETAYKVFGCFKDNNAILGFAKII